LRDALRCFRTSNALSAPHNDYTANFQPDGFANATSAYQIVLPTRIERPTCNNPGVGKFSLTSEEREFANDALPLLASLLVKGHRKSGDAERAIQTVLGDGQDTQESLTKLLLGVTTIARILIYIRHVETDTQVPETMDQLTRTLSAPCK
jgi:hypothetical protein